jgi:formylglycine-generating enzyme required for sulfatase activity
MKLVSVAIALMFGLNACGNAGAPGNDRAGAGGEAGAAGDGCDADGDGHELEACGGEDCDDARDDVYPGARDVCDGEDNDCDGNADQDDACDCAEAPPEPELGFSDRVCLSGGWFDMGMSADDPQGADIAYSAVPVHRVFVSPFYLDAYEVTNRRFIACLDAGVCELEPPSTSSSIPWDREKQSTEDQLDRPFWWATGFAAEKFCAWAGGWLPSEAQWERAAAGLSGRAFPNGNEPPTCEQEWTRDCLTPNMSLPTAARVGRLAPNPEGIYDLAGNAREWVADLFSTQAYEGCPQPCKNPCFGCADKTGGDPSLAPGAEPWSYGHAIRGGNIALFVSEPGALVFFRSQGRDRAGAGTEGPASEVFNMGFRCAYPAAATIE